MRSLDKVIGYESIKWELYKIIDVIREPDKYRALGANVPGGLLLHGVPGIGKTLMAQSVVDECGLPSYVIRKDRSDGEFVDYIRETFDEAASKAPAVILLDDLDKFANQDYNHRDADEYVTVQACMDKYRDKGLFVIATTNDMRSLPKSLVRRGRFDYEFHMSFPEDEDAKKIIAFYLKDKKVSENIDVDEILRYSQGRSCADLKTVLNEAGILAGYENKSVICQDDLRRACLRTFWNIGKSKPLYSAESIRRMAVHEAGHAALIEYYYPGEVSLITLESSRRNTAFVMRYKDNGCRSCSFKDNEIEIMISLAGKAASELILGEIDMGTHSDLHKAYYETSALIDNIAAYDFQSWCHGDETSQRVLDHKDEVTGVEMARYYSLAKQILVRNRDFLEALIEAVIEKKTVFYKEISSIREQYLVNCDKSA